MSEAEALTYKIDNKRPVELTDLTNSLTAFAREYQDFSSRDDSHVTSENVRLYIERIESGSIIAQLVASSPALTFDFIQNANSIFAFGTHLKKVIDVLTGKSVEGAQNISRTTLENVQQIVEPVAKDSGAQFNVSGNQNNVYNVFMDLSSNEANAAQNRASRMIKDLQLPVVGRHRDVVLRWYQARNDPQSKAGDRAIIESISDKDVRTIFVDREEKEFLLGDRENPFHGVYVVDVDVETVEGRPALYKIVRIKDHLDDLDE